MKAITVFKETEEQLRAELIKAVQAMVVGHRDDEQLAAQPHHLHAVGNSDRKIEDVLDGPESITASNLASSSGDMGRFMS